MKLKKMLKKKKKFKRKFTANPTEEYLHREHMKRLSNCKRRINQVGRKNERKKNPNDPLSHPVKFFRRGKNKPDRREDIKLDYLFSEVNSLNKYGIP